jgi:hypothetical protein
LRKLGGTGDMTGPVMDDTTAERRADDRREIHSEGSKYVDDLVSQMSRAKDIASQVKHHVHGMGRLGIAINPRGRTRGNQQLFKITNLANMLREFRNGHFD